MVAEQRTEAVADVDYFGECAGGGEEGARACEEDELVDGFDFAVYLRGKDGVGVGGETVAETVDGEGWVGVLRGGDDVGIVGGLVAEAWCAVC